MGYGLAPNAIDPPVYQSEGRWVFGCPDKRTLRATRARKREGRRPVSEEFERGFPEPDRAFLRVEREDR
jgi:hypothetical protein